MITAEQKLQIRSTSALLYTKFTGTHIRTQGQQLSALKNLTQKGKDAEDQRKPYSGEMTTGAIKRLNKAIDLMVQTTKREFIPNPYKPGKVTPGHIGCLTLTIHNPGQRITGKEGHKNLLEPFLQWLRRSQKCYLYIWKAELQMQREDCNQLHYHLLLGKFIPYELIREKWNYLNQKAGYLNQYHVEHGHYNAPSVDIGGVIEYNDIGSYLKKAMVVSLKTTANNVKAEMAKDVQNQVPIIGKLWDCSMNLKEMSYFEVNANEYATVVNELIDKARMRVSFSNDNVTVYAFKEMKPHQLFDKYDTRAYKKHLDEIRTKDFEVTRTGVTANYNPKRYKPPAFEIRPLSDIGLFALN